MPAAPSALSFSVSTQRNGPTPAGRMPLPAGSSLRSFSSLAMEGTLSFGPGQCRRENRQQAGVFQLAHDLTGVRLVRDAAQFLEKHAARNQLFQLGFARIVVLPLGPLVHHEAEAHAKPDQAQQARWLFIKRVGMRGPQLFRGQIRQAVGGVDQQAARAPVERERDGIDGEIPPAQIVLDERRCDLRLCRRASKISPAATCRSPRSPLRERSGGPCAGVRPP